MHDSPPASSSISQSPSIDFFDFDLDNMDWPRPQQANASIYVLPPELLSVIFSHAIEDDPFHTPVILSHVSWMWRQTALSTPCLWRAIHVTLPTSSPKLTFLRTNAWLSRGGLYPVNITLHVNQWTKEDGSTVVLECLRQHACHWGRFILKTVSHYLSRLLFSYFMRGNDTCAPIPGHRCPQRFEMLSRIDLNIGLPQTSYNNDDSIIAHNEGDIHSQEDINHIFQSLINVSPKGLRHLNMAVSAIPSFDLSPKSLSKLHLTTLQIFERSSLMTIHTPFVTAAAFLNLVSLCPHLEVLTFRGSTIMYDPDIPPPQIEGCINLPSLRTLCIAQTSQQCFILSYLAAPNLRTLQLFWLNQETIGRFQDANIFLQNGIDLSVISSASEELTEYSQSPWTDILTGTGLRVFIFNSGGSLPYLEVLDMDFSDMRSPKDFKWVLARTPALEVFRIIGSDMSDTVLNALSAPIIISREEEDAELHPEWLCPQLKSLELSRCSVITGQGIVGLSRARGKNSSLREKDGSLSTLEKFDVDGCAMVDCTSIAVAKYLIEDEVCFDVKMETGLDIFSERGIYMPSPE